MVQKALFPAYEVSSWLFLILNPSKIFEDSSVLVFLKLSNPTLGSMV